MQGEAVGELVQEGRQVGTRPGGGRVERGESVKQHMLPKESREQENRQRGPVHSGGVARQGAGLERGCFGAVDPLLRWGSCGKGALVRRGEGEELIHEEGGAEGLAEGHVEHLGGHGLGVAGGCGEVVLEVVHEFQVEDAVLGLRGAAGVML